MAVAKMERVIVIGGGIAGLAAAYELQKQARRAGRALTITLLEREAVLGGKIRTERRDGFVIEGGPDTFIATKPWALDLCRELGLEGRLQGADMAARRVYVLHHGRLVPLPDGLAMMIPSRIRPLLATPLLSPLGKIRMGLDWLLPAGGGQEDESLGAFIARRLGRQAYERLIEPLMSGIYAGDGDRLSLQATFPFLKEWEREHGGLVRGALALRRKRRATLERVENAPRSLFLTPRDGLSEIVQALQTALAGQDLRLGQAARALAPLEGGYRVTTEAGKRLTTRAVIVAVPAYAAARLLAPLDPTLADSLAGIEYASSATVSLAYAESDLPRPLDGHGYVIPRAEDRPALACTWTSSKFPHRAPQGQALLRIFIGRAGQDGFEKHDDQSLLTIARREVASTLGLTAKPQLQRVFRWPRAMPQYNLGHPERLQTIDARLAQFLGLYLAGAAYRGVGIPDCIHSGQQAARAAWAHLAQAREQAQSIPHEVSA